MDDQSAEPALVAPWIRALAWVIVLAGCLAIGAAVYSVWLEGRLFARSWYQVAPFVIAVIWGFPLFCVVAIRGRAPKYWPLLGTQHWQGGRAGR
jgi:hypothetical protein